MRNVKSKTVGGDRATLASIIEGSDDAILSMDLAGIIMTWNAAAELLFGYSEREIVGQPITLLFPPERMAEERRILTRLRDGQGVEHYEKVRLKKKWPGRGRVDLRVPYSQRLRSYHRGVQDRT